MSNKLAEHWNNIYAQKPDNKLGWFEADGSQTINFFPQNVLTADTKVFIAGAGKTQLIPALATYGCQLILNDISSTALQALAVQEQNNRQKNATKFPAYQYLLHDISQPLNNTQQVDIWIDRAVLHFLISEQEIKGYFDNVHAVVKPEGYVLLAQFASDGASICAGLEVHRYSAEELIERMGDDFQLINQQHYVFINPFGDARPYIYCLFQRKLNKAAS